jgi:XTP/dITP diphosphohydrolase
VLATANPGKVAEMSELLAGLPCRILSLADFPGLALPPEGDVSYAENALAKARAVAASTRCLAMADDSGLEVDALGGRPGVLSARYGGEGLGDAGRCQALLAALRDVPAERRTARFRSVIALCAPSGREAIADGVVDGVLLGRPQGSGGFGYDPLFYYPPLGATFAELPAEAKNRVSHRARAVASALPILRAWLSQTP